MNITHPDEETREAASPSEDTQTEIVIDMTDLTEIAGKALRVELRRIRDPVTGPTSPAKKILEKSFLIGLINPEDLPVEGENFYMPYHSFNSMADFGSVDSGDPVTNLVVEDPCYYFQTKEGQWRLKILDSGN